MPVLQTVAWWQRCDRPIGWSPMGEEGGGGRLTNSGCPPCSPIPGGGGGGDLIKVSYTKA